MRPPSVTTVLALLLPLLWAPGAAFGAPETCAPSSFADIDPKDLTGCVAKSGLVLPPPSPPTTATMLQTCGVPECMRLLNALRTKGLGECLLGSVRLDAELLAPIARVCETKNSPSPTMTSVQRPRPTSSSSVTTAAPPRNATSVPSGTPRSTPPATATVDVTGHIADASHAGSSDSAIVPRRPSTASRDDDVETSETSAPPSRLPTPTALKRNATPQQPKTAAITTLLLLLLVAAMALLNP